MRNIILICVSLTLTCPCLAKTITVDDDGPADFTNIQAAINDADDGDTVLVKDGTYTGEGNRDIDFLGKAITVRSQHGPENCIIDCNDTTQEQHSGFLFYNDEDANSVLDGFTIIGVISTVWDDPIGAIYSRDSSPNITNCNITGNTSWGIFCSGSNSSPKIKNCSISHSRGGGIYSRGGSPSIINCNITNNIVCGILCWDSSPIIKNCNIANNTGHGIYCPRYGSPTITNCNIIGNSTADYGGGIRCQGATMTVNNCIIWANQGPQISLEYGATIRLRYNDIQGGQDDIYCSDDSSLSLGLGNIDADPCFVKAGYWVDVNDSNVVVEPDDPNAVWLDGDYHLLPNSPCIDTGDPNYIPEPNETDLDRNPRVLNGRIDMGAYEYLPPVEVELKLTPQMLSCESKGNWLKAHVTFPEEIFPEDIDVNTPAVADPPGVESEFIEVFDNGRGQFDVQIYFDRQTFCEALSESEDSSLEVTVTGSLTDGQKFQGSDTIRLLIRPRHHRIRQNQIRRLKPQRKK